MYSTSMWRMHSLLISSSVISVIAYEKFDSIWADSNNSYSLSYIFLTCVLFQYKVIDWKYKDLKLKLLRTKAIYH